jgi:hypothetical protein
LGNSGNRKMSNRPIGPKNRPRRKPKIGCSPIICPRIAPTIGNIKKATKGRRTAAIDRPRARNVARNATKMGKTPGRRGKSKMATTIQNNNFMTGILKSLKILVGTRSD